MTASSPGSDGGTIRTFVEAFVPAGLILLVVFFLWQRVVDTQSRALGAVVQSEAGYAGLEVDRSLAHHAQVIARLARVAESKPDSVWEQNVEAAELGDVQFRAVARLDTAFGVQTAVPADVRASSWLAPGDPLRERFMRDALANHPESEAVITSAFDIGPRGRGVLVVAPVLAGERTRGYVVGLIRLHDLFDAALARARRQGFEVSVHDGAVSMYGPVGPTGGAVAYARDAAVESGLSFWTVRLWPSDDTFKRLSSWAPSWVMVLGTLLAFAVGNIVLLMKTERRDRALPHQETGFEAVGPRAFDPDIPVDRDAGPSFGRAGSPSPPENTENPAPEG
jgi:sensor domain CHASE-containing protein